MSRYQSHTTRETRLKIALDGVELCVGKAQEVARLIEQITIYHVIEVLEVRTAAILTRQPLAHQVR